jgi:hypothetical protein
MEIHGGTSVEQSNLSLLKRRSPKIIHGPL